MSKVDEQLTDVVGENDDDVTGDSVVKTQQQKCETNIYSIIVHAHLQKMNTRLVARTEISLSEHNNTVNCFMKLVKFKTLETLRGIKTFIVAVYSDFFVNENKQ